MVTVVLCLKLLHRFVKGLTQILRQFTDGTVKHREQFLLGDAAKGFVTAVHTDVFGLVETAEHAYLRKFRHTRKEDKAEMRVGILEDTIEAFQQFAMMVLKFLDGPLGSPDDFTRIEHIKDGLVVFVYQHHNLTPRLFVCRLDDTPEAVCHSTGIRLAPINVLHIPNEVPKAPFQFIRILKTARTERKVEHRIFRPFLLKLLDGQTFEQFLLPQKIALQGGEQQTFTETSRTAQKIHLTFVGKSVDQGGLVHIDITVFTDGLERLYANGIFHSEL